MIDLVNVHNKISSPNNAITSITFVLKNEINMKKEYWKHKNFLIIFHKLMKQGLTIP